jgi:hypothetical protein
LHSEPAEESGGLLVGLGSLAAHGEGDRGVDPGGVRALDESPASAGLLAGCGGDVGVEVAVAPVTELALDDRLVQPLGRDSSSACSTAGTGP